MPSADFESNEPAPLRPRQDPPPPPVAPGVADLLLLARALLQEGGKTLPGESKPGAKSGQLAAPGQARGPLPKEQKKFYKLGNLPAPPSPAPAREPAPAPVLKDMEPDAATSGSAAGPVEDEEEEAEGETETIPSAPVTAAAPAAAGERVPIRGGRPLGPMEERTGGRRRSLGRQQRLVMIAVGVAAAAGSFFVGLFLGWMTRPPVEKTPVPGPAAARETQPAAPSLAARALAPNADLRRALALIDEAEAAHGAGDWKRMDALLEQSGQAAGPNGVPELLFHRAENAVRRGDLNAANVLAQRALDTGEDVAKAYALRAVIAQRSRRPEVALPLLEAAGRADPFEGRYLFYQSQSLRALGKLQESTVRLRRALDRVEDPGLADSYRLALRLTQVELGEDAVFGEELTRRLAEPNPAPDWLVTAAARDCQAGRLRDGAELLRRAFAQSGPGYAAARLGDVFFRPYADRPELAPLFAQYLPPPPVPAAPPAPPAPTPASSLLATPPPDELVIGPLRPAKPEAAPTAAGAADKPPQP